MNSPAIVSPSVSQANRLCRSFFAVGRVPRAAIREAVAHWDALAPVFLARLQAYLDDPEGRADDADALLIPVHLFAQMRDARAYRSLIALVSLPSEQHEAVLGDAVTMTLNQVAASVFDGDPLPMEEAILDPRVDEFVAHALFEALAFLTADGRVERGRMRLFVERCQAALPRDEDAGMRWVGWQKVISYLGLTEYLPCVREAFRQEWIPGCHMDWADFEADLAKTLDAHSQGGLPADAELGYFGDAIEEFSGWYGFTPAYLRDRERWARQERTRLWREARQALPDAWRQVGRNAPCPCGSGRKYKKCCLGK